MSEIERMREAARKLYLSGNWSRESSTPEEDAKVWEEFRDAMGFARGTATSAGLGAKFMEA